MDTFLASHFQAHYKKFLLLCTATATVYLIKRYLDKKKATKKEKKKLKEFPTVHEIQKFIEELPFDATNPGRPITLQDLLGELSEFSEDEEWRELIASVHTMYKDRSPTENNKEDTGSLMSIYEDPNVISLNGDLVHTSECTQLEGMSKEEQGEVQSKGEGDISSVPECSKVDGGEVVNDEGQGDKMESVVEINCLLTVVA